MDFLQYLQVLTEVDDLDFQIEIVNALMNPVGDRGDGELKDMDFCPRVLSDPDAGIKMQLLDEESGLQEELLDDLHTQLTEKTNGRISFVNASDAEAMPTKATSLKEYELILT